MLKRFRRTKMNPVLRELLTDTRLDIKDFIYPLFVVEGENIKRDTASMPGVYQMSIDEILKEIKELQELGINSILLFGVPNIKDSIGSDALSENGIIARAIRAIKSKYPDIFLISDLCFCEYTDHGHCGILDANGNLDNDKTLEILKKQALIHASSGIDMIAPSGMIDGNVITIRSALDEDGFTHLPIMSYSTKFASSFYGPFRDIACCAPSSGDRKSYQLNPANKSEALECSQQALKEGADILMVKPALAYLDIIKEIKDKIRAPLAVYNVSGEYSMLKLAGNAGAIDYDKVLIETMLSFKRAGADIIISYHAKEVAKLLKKEI